MSAQTDWNQRVEAIFQAALDLPEDQRAALVSAEAANDVTLAREVQSLLDSYAAARQSFLETPAHQMTGLPDVDAHLPESIGKYRILSRIGAGGMGVVYRAEQQNPRREIALKVMRPGITSRAALRRFELEAALLARLAHPGIAQIFEAGTYVADGDPRPFFAMELVEGAALMEHVQARRPNTRERLKLLASICDAVQFAHQKGIIHRDLKPSNIMVVEVARGGDEVSGTPHGVCPKILDFGVARTTDADIQATTMHTEVGQVLGTLAYMSPEQIAADARDIDTRSDVYALGVMAYEVLTGRLPIDVNNKTIGAAARLICESEPPALGSIDRTFRGDLSTIVQKALEKDPARRYASAGELAADFRHYLSDEPIAARRATTMYQFRKFARRHRGLVGGSLAALIVLIIGGVVSTSLAISRTKALAESERHRDIAQAVNDFLNNDLLGKANPYVGATHDARLRDVLDGAARAIESRFPDQPLVNATIRGTLGKTYYQLSAYDEVEKLLPPAIAIYARELGPNDKLSHELRHIRILANLQAMRIKEAEQLLDEQSALLSSRTGPPDELNAQMLGDLGILRKRQGRFSDSELAYRQSLEIYGKLSGIPRHKMTMTKENLGLVLFDQHKNDEAERLLRESADEFRELDGEDSADLAYALTNLGQIYKKSRPKAEGFPLAQACFDRAYDIRRRRLGEDHRETLRTRGCMAMLLDEMGDHAAGEAMQREVLERRMRVMEADHVDVLDSRFYVAQAIENQGRLAEAIELYRQSTLMGQARYGPEYYHVRRFRWKLAKLLRDSDDQLGLHEFFIDYFAALEAVTARPDAKSEDLNAQAYWLMNCDTECLRDPAKALVLARRAFELAERSNTKPAHTFAEALTVNGHLEEAVSVLQKTLESLPVESVKQRQAITEQLSGIPWPLRADGTAGESAALEGKATASGN